MAITLYLRNTVGHVGSLGSHGNFDLETTAGTTATQSIGANTPRTFVYYSATTFPNLLDWQTGTYTWYLDVTVANANVQLTSIKISRYDSTLATEKASDTGTPNLTLSTTGIKTGTISFASPNPANRAIDDLLVITITLSKLAGGGTQSVTIHVNGSGDSRLDTPLSLPIVKDIAEDSVSASDSIATTKLFTKSITEDAVTVGADTAETTETYTKSVNEDAVIVGADSIESEIERERSIDESPTVSASDSIEATKIPAGPSAKLWDVHFVEFPEDITDSVTGTTGGVSALRTHKYDIIEQIEATKTHLYNIVRTVSTTTVHLYNVTGKVLLTRTHKYDLLNSLTATKTHKYDILQEIETTKTHKYDIIEQITTTKTHKYNVEQAIGTVSATKTHKYHIEGKVQTTKTHLYDVLVSVTTSTTHKYHVITEVSTTKTHLYDVIAKITVTKTHLYDVIAKITATKTHKYNVLEATSQVTTSTTHIYNVLAASTKSVTHKYNIIVSATKTVTHKFDITASIAQTVTHKFNIIQKIVTTKTHLYNILNRVAPDTTKTHKYNILQKIQHTRTHKYNIVGRLYRTRTHRYDQGGKIVVSKRHRYEVGAAFELQELGGSTQAFIKFPERIRIIDIIADLNNTAIANVEIITSKPPPHTAIATVAIADEEYVPGSKLLTASAAYKPRHRIASTLIIPQVIDTIDNLAIAPYIAIEILEVGHHKSLHRSTAKVQLLKADNPSFLVASKTQIKTDNIPKIRIASATALEQTPSITRIGSLANLQIPYNLSNATVKIPEIMTRKTAMTLKTLINLLSSDVLFE